MKDVKFQAKPSHPLDWLFEPFEAHPTYLRRKMFGCEAAYLNGRLTLILAAGEEPWNGVLVATAREFHPALQAQWTQLRSHPVLGKWLYIPQTHPEFEATAIALVASVLQGDARIGVEPKPRKSKKKGQRIANAKGVSII